MLLAELFPVLRKNVGYVIVYVVRHLEGKAVRSLGNFGNYSPDTASRTRRLVSSVSYSDFPWVIRLTKDRKIV